MQMALGVIAIIAIALLVWTGIVLLVTGRTEDLSGAVAPPPGGSVGKGGGARPGEPGRTRRGMDGGGERRERRSPGAPGAGGSGAARGT